MFEENDPIFDEENQKKLIEKIQNAPDCKIFGVSKFYQRTIRKAQVTTLSLAIVFVSIVLITYNHIISIILLVLIVTVTLIVGAILSYLNFAHNYYKTFVSEFGIAKDSKWDVGAIPWEKIEYIEIKDNDDEIDYIIFRSGVETLGYRNAYFVTRLTLEIISEYIGEIDNWHIIDDLEETADTSNRFYMRSDIDKSDGQKKLEYLLLRDWIGEQDLDADQTQEHVSAKSDDELYELIINDPQSECILDYGNFSRIISKYSVIGIMFVGAILAIFYSMSDGPFTSLSFITSFVLFGLVFYSFFKSFEKLVVSPLGIVRFYLGSPVSIEWQHIESIDFRTGENQAIPFEFFGNKRRVYCPEHIFKNLLSMELIRKYISDLDEWNTKKRNTWEDGVFRLVRPDA